jgi:hypothetical protein
VAEQRSLNLHDLVANDTAPSGDLEPPGRWLNPPSSLYRINHIPVDHERFQFGWLYELETAMADQAQSFACGGGKLTFKFGLGHGNCLSVKNRAARSTA